MQTQICLHSTNGKWLWQKILEKKIIIINPIAKCFCDFDFCSFGSIVFFFFRSCTAPNFYIQVSILALESCQSYKFSELIRNFCAILFVSKFDWKIRLWLKCRRNWVLMCESVCVCVENNWKIDAEIKGKEKHRERESGRRTQTHMK